MQLQENDKERIATKTKDERIICYFCYLQMNDRNGNTAAVLSYLFSYWFPEQYISQNTNESTIHDFVQIALHVRVRKQFGLNQHCSTTGYMLLEFKTLFI